MKFVSSNQTWGRGIGAVQSAVGSPISNPIVENIYVSCEKDWVKFIATNLNITIRCEGEAKVEEAGEIIIPSKIITEIVRDLPTGDLIFEEKDGTIHLESGRFTAKLKGQQADQFPPFIGVEDGVEIVMNVDVFKDIVRKTSFAVTTEQSRYILDGLMLDLKEKVLNCVTTDGRRLAYYKFKEENLSDEEARAMIPSRTLQELSRSLPDEGQLSILIQKRKAQFICGDTTIVSNLLEDNFPRYERIIPVGGEFKAKLKKGELLDAVKRASHLSDKQTNQVIVKFVNNMVEITSERIEVGGEGRDVVEAEYEGEEIGLRFNYRFLVEYLRAIDEEEIEVELWDSEKPCIFRGIGSDSYLYELMPMQPPEDEKK